MLQKFFDDLGAAFSSDQMRLLVQIPWIRHVIPDLCGWSKWKEVDRACIVCRPRKGYVLNAWPCC